MALKDELRQIVDDKIQRRKEQAAKDKLSYEAGRYKRITEDLIGDLRDAAQKGKTDFTILREPVKEGSYPSSESVTLDSLPSDSTIKKVADYVESLGLPVILTTDPNSCLNLEEPVRELILITNW